MKLLHIIKGPGSRRTGDEAPRLRRDLSDANQEVRRAHQLAATEANRANAAEQRLAGAEQQLSVLRQQMALVREHSSRCQAEWADREQQLLAEVERFREVSLERRITAGSNEETLATDPRKLLEVLGEGDTLMQSAIPDPSSASYLERSRDKVPPEPPLPSPRLAEQQRVAWGVKPVTDPLAQGDLKDRAPATAVLSLPGWRSARVDLTKTG